MIYDALPQQQLSESIAALKTVQYALMSDNGVNEDSFAYLQMSAVRSLEDAIARLQDQGVPSLNGERHAALTESLRQLFEYESDARCPELLRRIKVHQATLFLS